LKAAGIGMKKELETELFRIGLVFLAIGSVLAVLYHFVLRAYLPRVPCLFSTIFGIYCPGCGGSRAVKALFQGRLLLALWYHPLVPYMAVIGGGFMITQGLHKLGIKCVRGWKFHNWYLYGGVVLLICNFLVKNILRLVWGIVM